MKRTILALLAATLVSSPCLANDVSPISLTDLNGRGIAFPANLPSPRTLVLVAFRHSDQAVIQGWKSGLALTGAQDDWLEIPVVGVSSGMVKGMIRSGMRGKYPDPRDKAHVAPLFGDAAIYAKDFGISPDAVAVLVIDREGHVLASAGGAFSEGSATSIRGAWHPG
jgi:hypothetical protein